MRTWLYRFGVSFVLISLFSAASLAKTTITHFAYSGHGEAYYEFVQNAKALFEAENPDIEINITRGSNYDQATTMVAGGVGPDIFDFSTNVAPGYFAAGVLRDLTHYLERDEEFARDDFIPLAMEGYRTDEEIFGLPISTFQIFAFYNKDLFDQIGSADPNGLGENWTWETAVDVARKMTRDTSGDGNIDKWGLRAANSLYRWPIFVHQAGGYLFDKISDPTQPTFETEPARVGLNFFADLFRQHDVVAASYTQFLEGHVGFTTDSGPSYFGLMAREVGDKFSWDVAELPKGPDNNGTMVIMNGFQMSAMTDHPDEAWRWLKFLTREEQVTDFMSRTGRTPARISSWQDFAATLTDVPQYLDAASDAIQNPASTTNYITPIYRELASASGSIIAPVLTGEKSVDQALQELQVKAESLFAELD